MGSRCCRCKRTKGTGDKVFSRKAKVLQVLRCSGAKGSKGAVLKAAGSRGKGNAYAQGVLQAKRSNRRNVLRCSGQKENSEGETGCRFKGSTWQQAKGAGSRLKEIQCTRCAGSKGSKQQVLKVLRCKRSKESKRPRCWERQR